MVRKGIKFCRYADDYAIFCNDRADAYRSLVFLSEKLANEGLVLQKKKTRILGSDEFREAARLLDPAEDSAKEPTEEQKLLRISVRFDPYSPTAVEDYEQLKAAVAQVDIIAILGREVAKITIDPTVAKQAIQAISALEPKQREGALKMLLEQDNLLTLAPVFVIIMRVVRDLYPQLDASFQEYVDQALCELYSKQSPLLSVELNLAYYLQALAGNQTQRKEEVLIEIFDTKANPLLRRLVIQIMARWKCHYWLTDVKGKYGAMSLFERRAFILASYVLGDEGRHWRDFTKPTWQAPELLTRDWYSERRQKAGGIPL